MSQIYLGNRILNPFVLDLTFSPYFQGKTFTVTAMGGGIDTITGIVPSDNHIEVYVPKPNTTYIVTCDEFIRTITTESYFGYYACIFSPDLAAASWDTIATISESGWASDYFNVGDEKDIKLTTGEVLTIQIYDFKYDDLTSGGKAGITFGLKNLMANTRKMNDTNTNYGGFAGSPLYPESLMYTWLQGDLYNNLPSDLKTIIKAVDKKTTGGKNNSTIYTNSMKIFLFSEVECFGKASQCFGGEGSQYPIFTDNASRIKKMSNGLGSASQWWERSPGITSSVDFGCISNAGISVKANANISWGVNFGFCV